MKNIKNYRKLMHFLIALMILSLLLSGLALAGNLGCAKQDASADPTATDQGNQTTVNNTQNNQQDSTQDNRDDDLDDKSPPHETEIEMNYEQRDRISVHDPSVVVGTDDDGKKAYYVFGSHIAQGKSYDLINWQPMYGEGIGNEYMRANNHPMYGKLRDTFAVPFEWAGYDDGITAQRNYAIWAPDVFWNEAYQWQDGSGDTGAYMYYTSNSSSWRRSALSFLIARDIRGPYEFGATILYSGFTKTDATDGSDRNTIYTNTHLPDLIAAGTLNSISDNWFSGPQGNTYNTDYAPNVIDPMLFYDAQSTLWMVYGSWSGGIFLLEINPLTGIPAYPGEDSVTEDGRIIDRYFGTKLIGGYHRSGEGPYIVYDETSGYYYLFVTYGGLAFDGGYNMRLFRAENPAGPYIDALGQTPVYSGSQQDNALYGIKMMGNFQLSGMPQAYMSPGHNSVFIDEDGQWYNLFHTRFDDGRGHIHEVRVHQMFMNKEGWPVNAPYEYSGDKINTNGYELSELTGTYSVIQHKLYYGAHKEKNLTIELHDNGTLSGDLSGTWEILENYHAVLTINDIPFTGVFFQQQNSPATNQVMTFSGYGSNNEALFASMPIKNP